jgi:hypothetical protein
VNAATLKNQFSKIMKETVRMDDESEDVKQYCQNIKDATDNKNIDQSLTEEITNIIISLLQFNPGERMKVSSLLKNEIFD